MKIVFLDIDGVLNGHAMYDNKYCSIDHSKMLLLNDLLEQTGAKVVLSSSWRYILLGGEMTLKGFYYLLATHGFKGELLDHTVSDEIVEGRENQILDWVANRWRTSGCERAEKWVVLDDLSLEIDNFVKTDGNIGLTEDHVKQAVEILS